MGSFSVKRLILLGTILILCGVAAILGVVIYAVGHNENSGDVVKSSVVANNSVNNVVNNSTTSNMAVPNLVINVSENNLGNSIENAIEDAGDDDTDIVIAPDGVDTYISHAYSDYTDEYGDSKFVIQDEEELEFFYDVCGGKGLINEIDDFNDYVIFVQIITDSSEASALNLKEVSVDDTVEFVIDWSENVPENDAQGCWFVEAIIPRDLLDGVDVDDWVSPLVV